jgi:hypothetical protein
MWRNSPDGRQDTLPASVCIVGCHQGGAIGWLVLPSFESGFWGGVE